MAIRYDSAHRGINYLFLSFLFFFILIITIANSFVERVVKLASVEVAHVVVHVVIKY